MDYYSYNRCLQQNIKKALTFFIKLEAPSRSQTLYVILYLAKFYVFVKQLFTKILFRLFIVINNKKAFFISKLQNFFAEFL